MVVAAFVLTAADSEDHAKMKLIFFHAVCVKFLQSHQHSETLMLQGPRPLSDQFDYCIEHLGSGGLLSEAPTNGLECLMLVVNLGEVHRPIPSEILAELIVFCFKEICHLISTQFGTIHEVLHEV